MDDETWQEGQGITPILYLRTGMTAFSDMEKSLEDMWKVDTELHAASKDLHKKRKRTSNGILADDTRENFNSNKFNPWEGPKKDKLPEEEIE